MFKRLLVNLRATRRDSEKKISNEEKLQIWLPQKKKKERKKIVTEYKYGNEILMDFVVLNRNYSDMAKSFCCENDYIDKFVRNKACKEKNLVTYAAIDLKYNKIVAIMTICCSGIYTTTTNLKKYAKHIVIPAIEIRNFAVDYNYQKMLYSKSSSEIETLSYFLFNDYLNKIRRISNRICGAEKIILYSVKEAYNFYKRCKFKEFKRYMNTDESKYLKGCIPMFFSLNE